MDDKKKESTPRSIDDAEMDVPEAIPGALPENSSEREGESGAPGERPVARLPDATPDIDSHD